MESLDIVVGSGPSGVAASTALLERGRNVLLLDASFSLEPEARALRDRLGATVPGDWQAADREQIGHTRRTEHSDSMRLFGSDFLFRTPEEPVRWAVDSAIHSLRPSFAHGGLSNGWGASVLPYRDADIADWPITIDDLQPHYQAVARLARVSNHADAISDMFPALADVPLRSLPPSRQAQELLARMERRSARLASAGVRFGLARQAVADDCRLCGQCLHGCPYRLIFNAGDALDRLLEHPRLEYRTGRLVTRFEETANGVALTWGDERIEGTRLFLGCGVLPTARIVLSSLADPGDKVQIKDSAMSYLPSLHRWSAGDPAREATHSLSQLFIEIDNRDVDEHGVHAQVYTWNDTFAPDMRERFAPFGTLAEPLVHLLSRRLLVAQTFLHSDSSDAIGLTLSADRTLVSEALPNPDRVPALERATQAVGKALRSAGVMPLHRLQRYGTVGASFHCGGTFPMRDVPGRLETDSWGRPAGLERVHIVDASVFPSIPATTITLSVMANAHRIAAGSPE